MYRVQLHEYQLCRTTLLQDEMDDPSYFNDHIELQQQLQKQNTEILHEPAQIVDVFVQEVPQLSKCAC